jgi:hypothetical protein
VFAVGCTHQLSYTESVPTFASAWPPVAVNAHFCASVLLQE